MMRPLLCRFTGGKNNVMIKPIVNTMNFPYLGDLVIK
jgi:hypothetical protein